MEALDAGGVRVHTQFLMGLPVEGGADFNVFLREVVGVDDDFADWVGVFEAVAFSAEAANSPEEAGVSVFVDDAKGGSQRCSFRVGWVAVPFAIGPFPEDVPDSFAAHICHLGDGSLGVQTGAVERWAHDE